MDSDFSFLIAMKQCEFTLLCGYVGKQQADIIMQENIVDLDSISLSSIKSINDIQSPDEYVFIIGKLVESRKNYQSRHRKISVKLKEVLAQLSEQIGRDAVEERLNNWLSRYNQANGKQHKSISEVIDIAKVEKLLDQISAQIGS